MRLFAALIVFATAATALDVRKSPEEYAVQGRTADFKIGADFMVRSFLAGGAGALHRRLSPGGSRPSTLRPRTTIDLRRFVLRVNGKTPLLTQTPGFVAASMKYPDWQMRPNLQAGVGMGDRGILIGRPRPAARFPGDRRPDIGNPPGRTTIDSPPKEEMDYVRLVEDASLPEGKRIKPVAGYLYFPFDGKLKSVKTVELLIDDVVLKLR
jgi:hypothetical protein